MAKITGGGIQGNKNVSVGQRLGAPRKGSSPAGAADQIGQTVAFRKDKLTQDEPTPAQSLAMKWR